jgi:hypothetical protein
VKRVPKQKPGKSKQDYGTPWELIRAIEARWGKLTIDLAARADNAKAPLFITPEENSLIQNRRSSACAHAFAFTAATTSTPRNTRRQVSASVTSRVWAALLTSRIAC